MKTGKSVLSKILRAAVIAAAAFIILPLFASAESVPSGKPVTNEAEFLAMDRAGEYYLANDIELTKSYSSTFTGTLNGNGKTIKTSVSVFKIFDGTVRDLTITGTVKAASHAGAFAASTNGMTARNVTNRATVSCSGAAGAGGILGSSRNNAKSIFVGCINYGDVTASAKSGASYAGGIAGFSDTVEMYDCVNYGKITNASNAGQAGGMCGAAGVSAGENDAYLVRCSNFGEVTSKDNAAGMIAKVGISGNVAPRLFTFICCENAGKISGVKYVGGIAGYGYGTFCERIDLKWCINTGTVSGGTSDGGFVSQFFAYCNYAYPIVTGCFGCGELKQSAPTVYRCLFGVSSATASSAIGYRGNYLNGKGTDWFTYALDSANSVNRVSIRKAVELGAVEILEFTDEELKNGTATMFLNRALGYNIFYQDLANGGMPSVRPEAGYVVYDLSVEEDKFINGSEPRLPLPDLGIPVDPASKQEEPEPETTTGTVETEPEPVATDEATTVEEKKNAGCGSAVSFAAAAAVLLFPVILRKKDE